MTALMPLSGKSLWCGHAAAGPVVVAISWARVMRQDHTVLQVVARAVMGAAVAAAVMAPLA